MCCGIAASVAALFLLRRVMCFSLACFFVGLLFRRLVSCWLVFVALLMLSDVCCYGVDLMVLCCCVGLFLMVWFAVLLFMCCVLFRRLVSCWLVFVVLRVLNCFCCFVFVALCLMLRFGCTICVVVMFPPVLFVCVCACCWFCSVCSYTIGCVCCCCC